MVLSISSYIEMLHSYIQMSFFFKEVLHYYIRNINVILRLIILSGLVKVERNAKWCLPWICRNTLILLLCIWLCFIFSIFIIKLISLLPKIFISTTGSVKTV